MLNLSCIPGYDKSHLVTMYNSFHTFFWIQSAYVLLRVFASMFRRNTGLQFPFLVMSLSGFGISMMLASQNNGNFQILVLLIFFYPILFLLSFQDSNDTNISSFVIVPQFPGALFFLFPPICFPLCCSCWAISHFIFQFTDSLLCPLQLNPSTVEPIH